MTPYVYACYYDYGYEGMSVPVAVFSSEDLVKEFCKKVREKDTYSKPEYREIPLNVSPEDE